MPHLPISRITLVQIAFRFRTAAQAIQAVDMCHSRLPSHFLLRTAGFVRPHLAHLLVLYGAIAAATATTTHKLPHNLKHNKIFAALAQFRQNSPTAETQPLQPSMRHRMKRRAICLYPV